MSVFLQSLMGKKVRITLPDSRIATGTLHCIDFSRNVILHDVEVRLPETDTDPSQAQLLASAMISGKNIIKIELHDS
jgi:small nuclear ribonucleoprotein (snRNP)-like protein